MHDVLLGQAYHLQFDPKLRRAMQPYPPLGALYAASVLRRAGHDVAFHDAMLADGEARWAEALDRERPRVAVLYEDNFNYLSKMCLLRMREAAFTMIDMARARGCTVVVGGSDASDHAERYLRRGAHYVVRGEGELTLTDLLDHLAGRADTEPAGIPGLAFLDADGRIVETPPRPVMRDLDALPFPAWDLVDLERYRAIWTERHGYFSLNLVTSRGCPFHCNWCAKPIWGQRYHARSPEDVVDEIAWLREHVRPDHLWFMDDMMGIKPGWLERFADLVEARGVRTPFKCLNRVDLLLRDGVIPALARAGCDIVWTGVESGSQKILDAMDKGIRVEQVREAAERLHAAGIRVGFFLQFGYPGETRADIAETFRLVRDCRPDEIGASVSYPLPGTYFYEAVRNQLGAKQNWADSDDLAMLYAGPFSTRFYRRLHRVLHKEFRLRKAWHTLRRPDRAARPLREAAVLAYHAATLPAARLRMELAARLPHEGVAPVAPRLAPEEAAVPSPS